MMSNHLNVVASKEIDKRAHVLAIQKKGENKVAYIVANIYAPNPNSNEKLAFFEKVVELIEEMETSYDCDTLILGGDFTLTFEESECKNRLRTVQEKKVADCVRTLTEDLGLVDVWKDISQFTWRRPNTDCFSCLDHVLYSKTLRTLDVQTNWALSFSDHAAVEIAFCKETSEPFVRSKLTRLDPSLIKTPEDRIVLETNFVEMWTHADNSWDPHTKLEYAKLCIRTVGEKLQAERKRKEVSEEEEINEELNSAIDRLEKGCRNERSKLALINYVEELRGRKEVLVEKKGERLAEKLGSKWYNEGEKSTRYFLRLLNRNAPDKFTELINSQNQSLDKPVEIEEEIVNFYKTLYENYDSSNLEADNDDSFFNNITPISDADASDVVREITVAELERTLHTCRDSAPGPDGIPYSYLGALWTKMGPLICDAWNWSLATGKLCQSHKSSFLRLIPKVGKDMKKLTNWRPITLSNCDHKIITKVYSTRMAEKVSRVIKGRQTAYLKGRLINDNIRAINASIHLANLPEENIDALLVSLDAKKAFDSVEHSYIERCLDSFGLKGFIKIFRVLYDGLRSDILINGKIVSGYSIKRGVKQGDALSCILFIMCMEPLITNIENNSNIVAIASNKLDAELPKAYTYADDLNCTIRNTPLGVQAIFDEYSRLTRLAGLELNADKTEIMSFTSRDRGRPFRSRTFDVTYLRQTYRLETIIETKINGIFFQQDETAMRRRNVNQVKQKIESQLKRWSSRNLTTLGKILIVKTFGISQIIYLLQSITLECSDFKLLNEMLYKFIWNRHFQASKAPERIKREYLNTSVKNGGFGMLNIVELDDGLKLKALGRMLDTKHPMLELLKNKINFDDFFFPRFDKSIDTFVARGVELLELDRQRLWDVRGIGSDVKFVSAIRSCKITNVIKPQYRNNITIFMLLRAGTREVRQLSRRNFDQIKALFRTKELANIILNALALRVPELNAADKRLYRHHKKWVDLSKLSSKDLRQTRADELPICIYKCGLILNPAECSSWLRNLNSLKSIAHKNAILRFVHGDIYSNERLHRFGMRDNPNCESCGEVETIEHKIYKCRHVEGLWQSVATLTGDTANLTEPDYIVGAYNSCTVATLTIHAELVAKLIRKARNLNTRPELQVNVMIKYLAKKEKGSIKTDLETLLVI